MSDCLHIVGGQALRGVITVPGSYGAGLAMLAAAAAGSGAVTLRGLPATRGLLAQAELLRQLGRTVTYQHGEWHIAAGESQTKFTHSFSMPRSYLYFLGPLVARYGECVLPLPSASPIGQQPIDLHLKALRSLGAEISLQAGHLHVRGYTLNGCDICLDVPSFGASLTAVTAALRAQGRTRIVGASRAPEFVDAVNLLRTMGARITGAGTDVVTVTGGAVLAEGAHEPAPDRIAAAYYLMAAAATGGDVEVTAVIPAHLRAVTAKLAEMGAKVAVGADRVAVRGAGELCGVQARTGFYPDFPSHLQPSLCSLLMRARGASLVTETVFDGRMAHLDELRRTGANIERDGQTAIIRGQQLPSAARMCAGDPGAAAGLTLAALMAPEESIIENGSELFAWFVAPDATLAALGATVELTDTAQAVV